MAAATTKVGEVFDRLTVTKTYVEYSEKRNRNVRYVDCVCSCGKVVHKLRLCALGVDNKSCGCLSMESRVKAGKATASHGMSKSGTYKSWSGMWERCTRPTHPKYETYKERTPPERWRSFELFLEDMGERPEGYSIERKDNEKPYGPGNCVWIPSKEQGANTSRVRFLLKGGERFTLPEACRSLGLNAKTVSTRLYALGWSLERALGVGWEWVDKVFEKKMREVKPTRAKTEVSIGPVRSIEKT